jgi:hypothetical protein
VVNNVLCFACYAEGTLPLCHFGSPHILIHAEKSPKSFVSPTSKKFARNSFVSPTYAKTRGWGGPLNFQLLTLNRFSPLTPTIPVHTRGSPVSPIIPVHPQKQGGGDCYPYGNVSKICRRADNFIQSRKKEVLPKRKSPKYPTVSFGSRETQAPRVAAASIVRATREEPLHCTFNHQRILKPVS